MAKTHLIFREQWIPRPIEAVFDFFSRSQNLQTITPPWLDFKMVDAPELQVGSLIHYKLRIHGIPIRWTTEITEWEPPFRFVDVQLSGPYKFWRHEHRFAEARGGTTMTDIVRYGLRLGPLGHLAHWLMVRHDVEAIFDYRAQRMAELFKR